MRILDVMQTAHADLKTETILVLGGTGKTGRRVIDRLRARDLPVRVGSRSADPPFDWEDRATWAPALRGASSAYVSFYPDLAVPGACETIAAFAEQAVAGGTRRLVLLSGRGEEEAQRAEQVVQSSGAEWTVVRCSWFMQNFSVAVAALTEDGHAGRLYELTGPRALTFAQAVEEIGHALGRKLSYAAIPMEAFTSALADEDVPADVVALLSYLFSEVLGRNEQLGDGVQRALGREPRDFTDYAREAAATGIWAPSEAA